ncbi:beta-ketoacyl-ACP synthase II [Dyadobacter sp. CY345]|uniref:beta-ketoacyl-ACP synthase II n=1 Tax=Dyadobacter sp. CY345 TaxID=2909335 RepID=UPI001F282B4E|nr:beta-ketoacyl-ACP synthase II [Dyadobacter sp. CY345]MCF2444885.1 beta-ketoacyl-ACP synthase II [Dyadobacter sp. CY345]
MKLVGQLNRVVITGLGALTPLGNNINDFWNGLLNGVSGAGPITKFDTTNFKTKFACEIKGFNPQDFFDRNEARKYDPFTQYALVSVAEAVANAGIDFDKLNKNRVGVIWGSGNGGIYSFQEAVSEYATGNGIPRFNPYFYPKMIVDIASGVISIKYGLRGVNFTSVSACASANTAIIEAFNFIQWGKADMIITGGSEAPIYEVSIGGFNATKALSTNNANAETACKPFDPARDGFVMGEGAGAIILESYEHAVQRGANIIAEIVGGGMTADAFHLTSTHPEGEGTALAMQLALDEAGISASEIDYLNVHGTASPVGDISELYSIETIFGRNPDLSISATKSMTGHLLGAAGAIEAIACIKAITDNIIPPTINTLQIEPEFDGKFDMTLGSAKKRKVEFAMNNTLGFGGHIASSIFKKFQE